MQTTTTQQIKTLQQFNRAPARLIRAHTAIKECIRDRDYHSLRIWATDAENIEIELGNDVTMSDHRFIK